MQNKKLFESELPVPIAASILIVLVALAWGYTYRLNQAKAQAALEAAEPPQSQLEEKVVPAKGIELPVTWGELGKKLTDSGIIDKQKFKKLYTDRNEWNSEYEKLLSGNNREKVVITPENSAFLLNLFWAVGLAQENPILFDQKEMMNPQYAGDRVPGSSFASTGGWPMAVGNMMDHYGKHRMFELSSSEQSLVDKMSRGIYRPCCGNSTHFPDCNHGMAMLGLLELMASQGASEQEMWQAALAVNSYWFPDTYLTLATYMKEKRGIEWQDVNAQEVLGMNYSSGQGYKRILTEITPVSQQNRKGGCGI